MSLTFNRTIIELKHYNGVAVVYDASSLLIGLS